MSRLHKKIGLKYLAWENKQKMDDQCTSKSRIIKNFQDADNISPLVGLCYKADATWYFNLCNERILDQSCERSKIDSIGEIKD